MSQYGANHDAPPIAGSNLSILPARVQYEGGGADTSANRYYLPDVRARMKISPSRLCQIVHQKMAFAAGEMRPLILCEYAHAMGNSLGGFAKCWQAFRRYPVYRAASSGTGWISR
ncbi:hypothetical protein DMH88_12570 [Escherichia coli]|nr:hypothetical protein [Escherichia coli]